MLEEQRGGAFGYFFCSTTMWEEPLKAAKQQSSKAAKQQSSKAAKQHCISKNVVMDAWGKVESNSGSGGVRKSGGLNGNTRNTDHTQNDPKSGLVKC
jgi:hypothetical protein